MVNYERQEIKRFCDSICQVDDFRLLLNVIKDIRDKNVLWDFFIESARLKDGESLSIDIDDGEANSVIFDLYAVRLETDEEMNKRISKEIKLETAEKEKNAKKLEQDRSNRYQQYLELKKEFEKEE